MNGPYATESEARGEARRLADEVNDRARRLRRDESATVMDAARAIFVTALDGIELGAYDQRIVDWLATWEPATLVVLGGIVERAKAVQP